MKQMGFADAFASYKAKLVNVNWAVSSISDDGALVISCWHHLFKRAEPNGLVYRDNLRRWGESNQHGKNLLAEHLSKAQSEGLPIRIVVATAEKPEELETVSDASTLKKTFHIRKDWIGRLTNFDGENFDIEIRPAT